ncbi:hypothetical protein FRC04_006678 [Tulasnella sp. 424]|nr:hypothetical protein FRC04_006678 [Tulasnella sp. 424]
MTIQTGVYRIRNLKTMNGFANQFARQSGTYLDSREKNREVIHGWDSRPGSGNQEWEVRQQTDNSYTLRNVSSRRYAHASNGDDRTRAEAEDSESEATHWEIHDAGDNTYNIDFEGNRGVIDLDDGRVNETSLPPGLLLRPVLPSSLLRYDRPISRWRGALTDVVPANTRPMNTTCFERLPAGWGDHTTPEGVVYFRHEERSIVTYADIRHPSTEQVLLAAHDHLVALGGAMDLHIIEREVFIQVLEKSSYTCEVGYYFVDHAARLPFWVHPVPVQDLGLPSFGTGGQLKASLVPEYWTHLEYFPAHQLLDAVSELELISILRHGCVAPVRPFRIALMIAESSYRILPIFLRLPKLQATGHPPSRGSGRALHVAAEFKSRLKPGIYLLALVTLSFGLSLLKFDRLTELWNGRVVYRRHWSTFFDEQQKEWMRLVALSLVVFIGAVIFICVSGPNPFAVASASFSFASVMGGLILYVNYNESRFKTASDISYWISTVESSHSGLLPLAIRFTMPQAAAIYSAFLLLLALLKLAADSLRDSDAVDSALLLAAAFGPAIIVYLMLRVDTRNCASDSCEQLVDARESSCDELGI